MSKAKSPGLHQMDIVCLDLIDLKITNQKMTFTNWGKKCYDKSVGYVCKTKLISDDCAILLE